jgi:multidrug efflux pump subunit AcrA (membrane-fusion protein)
MFTAKVVTTSEAISPASRTLLTELEVDNSQHQILPYSFGEIKFEDRNPDPILTLPSSALLFRSQGLQVATVNTNQTIELRPVRVGRDFGQTLEILGGVDSTDHVVSNPTDSLVSGVKVAVQSPSNPSAMR